MEWPFIAGIVVIAILGLVVTGLVKERWTHRKLIKQAKLDALVEAEREAVLESKRDERQDARASKASASPTG